MRPSLTGLTLDATLPSRSKGTTSLARPTFSGASKAAATENPEIEDAVIVRTRERGSISTLLSGVANSSEANAS